jgi:shikimate kinase
VAQIALIGFMGAGKTTAARTLGEAAADVDEVIEARRGRRIQDIFAQEGEAAFREVEEQVTLELLADPAIEVVALGGGAIGSARVRDALKIEPRHLARDRLGGRLAASCRERDSPAGVGPSSVQRAARGTAAGV